MKLDNADEASVPRPARMPGLAPRTRILDAAAYLFRRDGFSSTSMDAIAGVAKMSKRTLYSNFADKRAILEVVLDHFMGRRFAAITRVGHISEPADEEVLRIAQGLNDAATDEDALAMYRLLIAEAESLPTLALTANINGLAQAVDMLREPLLTCGCGQPDTAAHLLYDLVVLAPMHRRLVGADNLHCDVRVVVDVVLRGTGSAIAIER